MSHVVREANWGVVDIVVHEGRVFVQERWKYEFSNDPGTSAWTLAEKRRFHRAVDLQIWAAWSNKIKLATAGSARFARDNPKVPVNFDVRWVTRDEHWTVSVRKLPAGSTPTTFISNVDRPVMRVNLDSADLDAYDVSNSEGARRRFRAVPHEFGHTFPAVNDEYVATSPHRGDADSIMNIGREVRARHLQPLLTELNQMIPNCTFSA
jgi:hypothetical protein